MALTLHCHILPTNLSLFRHLSALRAFFIGSVAGSDRAKLSFFPIYHQLGIYTENK